VQERKEKEKGELATLTPLERLVRDAGPPRTDGTDKFYGLENVRLFVPWCGWPFWSVYLA
jgi:hypothetical protein